MIFKSIDKLVYSENAVVEEQVPISMRTCRSRYVRKRLRPGEIFMKVAVGANYKRRLFFLPKCLVSGKVPKVVSKSIMQLARRRFDPRD